MPDKIDRLVEAAIALCEPENGDEKATAYTRETLRKKFSEILHGDVSLDKPKGKSF